jgi:hypothetical protein
MTLQLGTTAAFALIALFGTASVDAGIALHIDSTNHQFWFSGSDTGYARSMDSGMESYDNSIYWSSPNTGGGFVRDQTVSSAFTLNGVERNAQIEIVESGSISLSFFWMSMTQFTDQISLVADSSRKFNYSGFSVDITGTNFETIFETVGATEWTLVTGTGFANLSAPVPEPSEWAGAAGLGVLALAAARKRRPSK